MGQAALAFAREQLGLLVAVEYVDLLAHGGEGSKSGDIRFGSRLRRGRALRYVQSGILGGAPRRTKKDAAKEKDRLDQRISTFTHLVWLLSFGDMGWGVVSA
jgi:hypothetical protein